MEENIFNNINFGPNTKVNESYTEEIEDDFEEDNDDNWAGFTVTPNVENNYFTQGKNYLVIEDFGDDITMIDDEGDRNDQSKCDFDIV